MKKITYVEVASEGQSLGKFTLREAARKAGVHANDLSRKLQNNGGVYVAGSLTFISEDGE